MCCRAREPQEFSHGRRTAQELAGRPGGHGRRCARRPPATSRLQTGVCFTAQRRCQRCTRHDLPSVQRRSRCLNQSERPCRGGRARLAGSMSDACTGSPPETALNWSAEPGTGCPRRRRRIPARQGAGAWAHPRRSTAAPRAARRACARSSAASGAPAAAPARGPRARPLNHAHTSAVATRAPRPAGALCCMISTPRQVKHVLKGRDSLLSDSHLQCEGRPSVRSGHVSVWQARQGCRVALWV